jgi:hypothetical protein
MPAFISHRGNIRGMDIGTENSVPRITEVLEQGFCVMVDVWTVGGGNMLALGSNNPRHPVDIELLKHEHVICRARTALALQVLLAAQTHCFAFEHDPFVVTTGGLIWVSPGHTVPKNGVCYLPEHSVPDPKLSLNLSCAAICSNFIADIREHSEDSVEVVASPEDEVSIAKEVESLVPDEVTESVDEGVEDLLNIYYCGHSRT